MLFCTKTKHKQKASNKVSKQKDGHVQRQGAWMHESVYVCLILSEPTNISFTRDESSFTTSTKAKGLASTQTKRQSGAQA